MKYILDNGSLESKILQKEVPDAQVIKVGPYNLNEWLVDIIEETDEIAFVYLPFCSGDLIKPDIDIRTDIATALHNYPKLRIILPFEQMDKPGIERRAANHRIPVWTEKHDKIVENYEKNPTDNKYHFVELEKDKYSKYSVGGNDSYDSKKKRKKKD